MALEQSINLDSKSKGGIVGISLSADALHRWFLTCHERAAITSAVRRMCGSDDPDRIGTHKEAIPKRVERDENDVQKIITCFKSGLMKDPFAEESDSLGNIATGVVLPADEAKRLLASEEKGKAQMNSFIVEYQHCQFLGCYSKPKDQHILVHDKEGNNQINQREACDIDGRQGSIWKIADRCKRPAGQHDRDPLL